MKISVFITSYNQEDYLKQAIDSVLAQSVPPYEIIVIDDGSADESRELIRTYAQTNPHLITAVLNESNLGIPRTKARAVDAARGDWITYCDGDDRWLPRKIEYDICTMEKDP